MTRIIQRFTRCWLVTAIAATMPLAAIRLPDGKKVTCANCHRTEAATQPKTAMGIGIEISPNQQVLKEHPNLTVKENGYLYSVERKNGASTYSVSDGARTITLPLRYAFGAHNLTFILEYQGHFYESLVSYYQKTKGLAITAGDETIRPHNLTEAIGRLAAEGEVTACFNCHGTGGVSGWHNSLGPVSHGELNLGSVEAGVRCERCHTGADVHMQAMGAGKAAPIPRKLGEMAAEEMSNFCGECHRTWESVTGQHLLGQKNVRFAPYRLANSQCFLGSDKRIRCTACHEPHGDLVRDDDQYDRICQSCHGGTPAMGVLAKEPSRRSCTIGTAHCVSCHMPKVQLEGSPAVFTDHDIRVVREHEGYPD